ncbi:hypothetical protein AOQ84DRAFT_160920 [Glonium stellatum]|uniref:Uncharacterized protein n=1 Tax=Glonium stellatum TaxID=574774 RepID=A0A8E2JWY5_9PEZI|nr:hypothetical protein AOQ84DRAFT_160920 [Glonium stellatum]
MVELRSLLLLLFSRSLSTGSTARSPEVQSPEVQSPEVQKSRSLSGNPLFRLRTPPFSHLDYPAFHEQSVSRACSNYLIPCSPAVNDAPELPNYPNKPSTLSR